MTKKTTINKIVSSKAFWIIISLLASFLLWTYIMSTEETTIEMTFSNVKVVYQGADDLRATRGLIVTGADADTVSVRLKGTRRVLGNLSSADLSAVIDVSGISQAREMQVSYSLQYPTNVDKSSITVLSKSPETISFSVVQEANKTLEVKGVFTGSVKDGYTAEPIQVDPSSITLYGPQEELDAVDSICVYVTRTDLDKSIAPTNCPYVLLDKDGNKLTPKEITGNYDTVSVSMPVLMNKDLPLTVSLVGGAGRRRTTVSSRSSRRASRSRAIRRCCRRSTSSLWRLSICRVLPHLTRRRSRSRLTTICVISAASRRQRSASPSADWKPRRSRRRISQRPARTGTWRSQRHLWS